MITPLMTKMRNEPLKVKKRGDDGHRVISLRIGIDMLEKLDEIAKESNRSRNEIIILMLESTEKRVQVSGIQKGA